MVLVVLVRFPSVYVEDGFRLVVSWFLSLNIGIRLGFLREVLQWGVLVFRAPFMICQTNRMVHTFQENDF